jgi:outer membrane lipoprotein-sorting protein
MLIVYSGKTDQVTHLPMSVSPAAFLLGSRVDLSRKVSVTKVGRRANAYVLTVVPRGGGAAGTLRLTFSRRPLTIKEWTVLDAKRKTTRIVLLDPRIDAPIDPVKFLFQKPPRRGRGSAPKRGRIERMDLPPN